MTAARPLGAARYALLLAGAFLVYASANSVVPVSAEIRAGLGLSGSGAALLLLPFAAGFGAGSFLWLAVARRRPPRLLLTVSLAAVAASSLAMLLVGEPAAAVTARFAVGVASAGYPAAAQAVITDGVAAHARARMIGGFVAAVVAGSFIGQAVTGALADLFSVDAALLVVCVAAPSAIAVALRRSLPDGPAGAGAACPDPGGGAGLVRTHWPVLSVAALTFGGYWLLLSELPVALREERFALTAAEAGALPSLGLAGIATALAAGRLADRVGHRAPMAATLSLGIGGLAATVWAGTPLPLFAAGYGVFLAAYWGFLPVASAEVAVRARADDRQPALMAFYAAMWTGAAVAPAAGALLPGWTAAALAVLGAWTLALVVAATRFTRATAAAATGR